MASLMAARRLGAAGVKGGLLSIATAGVATSSYSWFNTAPSDCDASTGYTGTVLSPKNAQSNLKKRVSMERVLPSMTNSRHTHLAPLFRR